MNSRCAARAIPLRLQAQAPVQVLHRDDGVVLASEPYDDHPGWRDIPDRHLVDVCRGEVGITALKGS